MDFSKLNKVAWQIRKQYAKRLGCPVMDISWKECLVLAQKVKDNVVVDLEMVESAFCHKYKVEKKLDNSFKSFVTSVRGVTLKALQKTIANIEGIDNSSFAIAYRVFFENSFKKVYKIIF